LSLDKRKFAQCEVRFIGHIVGSGHHRPDEQKLDTIASLTRTNTKKDIRKMLGIFNYFQSYIPHLAELSARFTDMLMKGKPNYVNWMPDDDCAFLQLQTALCICATRNLHTAKWGEPFGIYCDASHIAVGSHLVPWDSNGKEVSIPLRALSYLELNFHVLLLRRKLMLSYGHRRNSVFGSLVPISLSFQIPTH
jgi:hypothetical protein